MHCFHMLCGSLALTALLSACSPPPIEIATQRVGRSVTVKLSQDWGIVVSQEKAPCLRVISLFSGNSSDGVPIWQATAPHDVQCTHNVSTVLLGSAPEGFVDTTALTKLIPGRYTLEVSGIGYGSAIINVS